MPVSWTGKRDKTTANPVSFTVTLVLGDEATEADRADLRLWLSDAIDRQAQDAPPTRVVIGSWTVEPSPQ